VRGCKSYLFSLSVIVCWVAVKNNFSDRNKRIIRMWPYFSYIKNIKSVRFSVFFRHSLNIPSPGWETTFFNVSIKVVSSKLRVLQTHLLGLLSGEIFDSLIGLVMVLDIVNFTFCVNPFESMGAVTINVTVSVRCTTVAEQYCDLMHSLRCV